MEHKAWLSGSLLYRLLTWIAAGSVLISGIRLFTQIASQSKVKKGFDRVAEVNWYPEDTWTGHLFQGLIRRLRPLRFGCGRIMSDSWLVRKMTDAPIASGLWAMVIPVVTLYVIIDELGRDVFAGSTLFSLWDEAFLLLCFLWLAGHWLTGKQERLSLTPLDAPILLLAGVGFALMINVGRYPAVALDGYRVVIQYVLFFFVLSRWLTSDQRAGWLLKGMLAIGGALALHGFWQFLTGVETPTSWTDHAEVSIGPRVFSIVESPNILGSLMVLLLPLALSALLLPGQKAWLRMLLTGVVGAMGLCVLLTQSRGAWLGMVIALVVFCLLVRPVWLIPLGAGGAASLLLPPVYHRIAYLFTPQFVASSQRGGRMLRYDTGWRMFQEVPWTGVGLGHFGGAVAMNNKSLFPDTFYMDNYWLKTLVEMGIPGTAAFLVLMAALLLWGVRSVRHASGGDRLLAAGALSGMSGVLVHNFFENIFEVPYMVVYFWALAALVLYWGFGLGKDEADCAATDSV